MWGIYQIWGPTPFVAPTGEEPPDSKVQPPLSLVDFRVDIHRALGGSAFVFSAMAIVTGVMNYLVSIINNTPFFLLLFH
jgi:hypothetical protein